MGEYATGGGSGLAAVTGLAKRVWSEPWVGGAVVEECGAEEECGAVEAEAWDLLEGGRSTTRCFS